MQARRAAAAAGGGAGGGADAAAAAAAAGVAWEVAWGGFFTLQFMYLKFLRWGAADAGLE